VAVDAQGNLYIADPAGGRVLRVTPKGVATTVAGGSTAPVPAGERWNPYPGDGVPATSLRLDPIQVAVDKGDNLIVATRERVLRVASDGTIGSLVGTGPYFVGTQNNPIRVTHSGDPFQTTELSIGGLALGPSGEMYVSDVDRSLVFRVSSSGSLYLFAGHATDDTGSSSATRAALVRPTGLAKGNHGDLYIAETGANRVTVVTSGGSLRVIAGTGSPGFSGDGSAAALAELNQPTGVAVDSAGNLYIADTGNHRVRKVDTKGVIRTVAGTASQTTWRGAEGSQAGFSGDTGPAARAALDQPEGVAIDSAGNLLMADTGNHRVRRVTGIAAPAIEPWRVTVLPSPTEPPARFDYPNDLALRGLRLLGSAEVLAGLRLTPSEPYQAGAAWHPQRVNVQDGFDTSFRIRITPDARYCGHAGEGMTFAIQGFSSTALGDPGGALGYGRLEDNGAPLALGQGVDISLQNAIVLEMDTTQEPLFGDPDGNHLSLHDTRAVLASLHEDRALALTSAIPKLATGKEHTLRVHYFPGTLTVFLDDLERPVLRAAVNLRSQLVLERGLAWVGFTAATGAGPQTHEVLGWTFQSGATPLPLEPLYGDVNGDGAVDYADVVAAVRAIAGLDQLSPAERSRSDVNRDGRLDAADWRAIYRTAVWRSGQ
jgi:sugar lactone lactonase YvrE